MARRILRRFEGIIRNVILGSPIRDSILIPVLGPEPTPTGGNFLLESGDILLLETGDNLLLEG